MIAIKKIFIFLITLLPLISAAQNPTVEDVMDKILKKLETEIHPGSVDTLKSGSWEMEVTGIATTFMATFEVLKKAQSQGLNLIFTHEPTFYNHFDLEDDFGENDAVIASKIEFIKEHSLTIFRFHDIPHQVDEDMIYKGMIQKLDWSNYYLGNGIFKAPFPTIGALVDFLKTHFHSTTVRVVGDPQMRISKIKYMPGASGRHSQVNAFNSEEIDALIVGEAREWETIEYVRDAQESGIRRALIVMGHADSEEGGMQFVAEWLENLMPGVPVKFIPAGNPLWSPE